MWVELFQAKDVFFIVQTQEDADKVINALV